MRLFVLCLLACLTLASCRDAISDEVDPANFDAAEQNCLRDGGSWQPRANSGAMVCVRTPPDAGRSCQSARDCSGQCLARSRTCAPVTPLFGCNDVLDSSGRASTLCLQ